MARIPKVRKVGGSGGRSFKPIGLKSDVSSGKLMPTRKKKTAFGASKPKQSLSEMMDELNRTIKLIVGDKTIHSLISASTKDRKDRAKTQLRVFTLRSIRKDVFKFLCRSSGISGAKTYQVELMFSDVDEMAKAGLSASDILVKSNVKLQCSCEDFKYRYRYIATKGGFVLGNEQNIMPKITNPNLSGALCKHSILVLAKIQKGAFMKIFERYTKNKVSGKRTRVDKKDVISMQSSASASKVDI